MKKRAIYCVLIVLFISQAGIAQVAPEENIKKNKLELESDFEKSPKLKGIILGVHGARETMFEIGYFYYDWIEQTSGKIPAIGGLGYSISIENYINHNYIIAPKTAIWVNLLYFNVGMSFPWYFDMEKNNSFRVRPEIGFGSGDFKLTYAVNMAITNKDMNNISKHMVSVICFLNFNRKASENKQKW
ncbi:hypothetical protein IMCC3317_37510 [Kordia antarctica]|uniref:Outer membrane protein beta-barrel domain-containing protein n=1 Tax=Kordia antarctica TaxID=1218801 RepID=A0A7L4ZPG9_9FLAO|nr:hypothetical protein [Kordia antarctica]QHI38359.1 hypothetical protein IMCC3317_37510 [Kordia antarctica]